ncbi:MAG: RsmD family RNA methyltransferase [Fibrobacterota bacterium]
MMEIRIGGGRLRGRKIRVPEHIEDFRPTKSRLKDALCSSLMAQIRAATVLDICGGSGAIAFELLSRGAAAADVVENSPKRSDFIQRTGEILGFGSRLRVFCADASGLLQLCRGRCYDIIFFDPPYYHDELTALVPSLLSLLSPGGVLVYERARDDSAADTLVLPENCHRRVKSYGYSEIIYFSLQ